MVQVGDTLGRYTLLRRLPSSALGDLFLAAVKVGNSFGAPVALEILHAELARNLVFVQSAIEEARAASALTHPNILAVHEFAEDFGTYFLASEYVHGASLRELSERTPTDGGGIDVAIALFVAIEVCRALTFLHNLKNARGEPAGRAHGDIEPMNVRLSVAGEVKLGPFSTNRLKNRITFKNGVARRSPAEVRAADYSAPEVNRGNEPDERSDLFSVGVLLYEMLTGVLPTPSAPPVEGLTRSEAKAIAPPSGLRRGLAPELDALILRALDPSPLERWPTALAFRNALLGFAFSDAGCQKHFQHVGPELGRRVIALDPQPGLATSRPTAPSALVAPSALTGSKNPDASRTAPDRDEASNFAKDADLAPSQPDFDSTTSRALAAPAALMRSDSPSTTSQPNFQYLDFAEGPDGSVQTEASAARLWRSVSGAGVALTMLGPEEGARAARVSLVPNAVESTEPLDGNLAATHPPDVPFPRTVTAPPSAPSLATTMEERNDAEEATASTIWAARKPEPSRSAPEETMRVHRRVHDEDSLSVSQNTTHRLAAKEIDAVVATRQPDAGVTTAPAPLRSMGSTPSGMVLPPPPFVVGAQERSGSLSPSQSAAETASHKFGPTPANGLAHAPQASSLGSGVGSALQGTAAASSSGGHGGYGVPSAASSWPHATSAGESSLRARPQAAPGTMTGVRPPRDWMWLGMSLTLFAIGLTLGAMLIPRFESPTLSITTIPPGASVSINGRAFAQPTPLIIEVVPDEHLDIGFELEGYEPVQRQLTGLRRGEKQTFTASLSRVVSELHVSPVPAQVFLNGNEIGKDIKTMRLGMVDPERPAVLRVTAPKHRATEIRYSRGSRMPAIVKVRLKPD